MNNRYYLNNFGDIGKYHDILCATRQISKEFNLSGFPGFCSQALFGNGLVEQGCAQVLL